MKNTTLLFAFDDILRPAEEVIDSLSKIQILDYRKDLEKAIRSGTFSMPRWPVKDNRFQPKLRLSWDEKAARKYLQRILLNIDYKLEANALTIKQKR